MREFIKKRLSLTIILVLFVFGVMIVAFIIESFIMILLYHLGIFNIFQAVRTPLIPLLWLLLICTFIGTALAALFSNKALKPILEIIAATHQVAQGNFDVKVNLKGLNELEELSHSFNKMTHELSSIETLRNDFVNNFSHELKTPIVSLRGFAKLLKGDNLTEDERKEYLNIIITESERLVKLSTNILNLSKYENIDIISERSLFRLDEQIRRVIVMTEAKWSSKEISLNVEQDEVIFNGNEDLLQQIWLNLLDNAIKFSHKGGLISIFLIHEDNGIIFTIQDDGRGMDEHIMAHVFDKFYQGDASRSEVGNGLGLSVVKRIVDLCGGTIRVESELGKGSKFEVWLPR